MDLLELQRIKTWHVAHRSDHPLEYHMFDAVLTVWLMGWIGTLPVILFFETWLISLCVMGMLVPRLYVGLRVRAHQARRLRCDWIGVAPP